MVIYRSKIKNIILEFIPSAIKKIKGVIIICPGLPDVPKYKSLMHILANQGFYVIQPRYKGTWESGGTFANHSPVKDVENIINYITKNKLIELYSYKAFNIKKYKLFILGSSFGGTVALSLIKNKKISKIVSLSPIVNFKTHDNSEEQDLIWLGSFIQRAFFNAYRFSIKDWKKMMKGELFNPVQKLPADLAKKLMIFYDESDPVIDYRQIEEYISANNIKFFKVNGVGHLSFSKLSNKHLNFALDFFRNKSK